MLTFLIKRLKNALSANNFRLIVATSIEEQDNPIAAWAEFEEVCLIRGDQANVLSRYMKVLDTHPAPVNVRVTGDNPLTCPEIIQASVNLLEKNRLDYVLAKNFPYGTGVDVFTASLLESIHHNTADPNDREHINKFVLEHPDQFKIEYFKADPAFARPDLRMTIDTKEDFDRISHLLALHRDLCPWNIKLAQAIDCLDRLNNI